MNRGHVPAEVLASYADGSLADGMCLIVAGHLTFCPRCRDHLDRLEALGGVLLTEPAPGCCAKPDLGKIFSRIDQADLDSAGFGEGGPGQGTLGAQASGPGEAGPRNSGGADTSGRAGSGAAGASRAAATGRAALDDLPRCLRGRLGCALETPGWRALGHGVSVVDIPIASSGALRLLLCDPGVMLPEHEHRSHSAALILRGGLREDGRDFGRGDLILSRPGERHAPVIDQDGACLVLTLDEDAPLDIMPSAPSSPA